MINLQFNPEEYLIKLIDKATCDLRPSTLTEKAIGYIQKGIKLQHLSFYYKVTSVEDLLELDAAVIKEVETLIPKMVVYKAPPDIDLSKWRGSSKPYILPAPAYPTLISEGNDPLRVTYGTSPIYTTNC